VRVALATAALFACSKPAPPVPIEGPANDVAALAGHWSGEYGSPVTGRSGTIDFTVTTDGDSAVGVVMMIPSGFGQPLKPWRDTTLYTEPTRSPPPSVLTIRLIRVAGSNVHGSLVPYYDPRTGDRLVTMFDGRLANDTIAGTFVTQPGETVGGVTGKWWVARQKP
jgi:hypothetical protein